MRSIEDHKIGHNNPLNIVVMDEPGAGGACHHYKVTGLSAKAIDASGQEIGCDAVSPSIIFQKGPVKENGVNGITNEVLLAIVADRLRGFQAGPFPRQENQVALENVERALYWLHKRTKDRMERGVEGVSCP